MGTIFLHEFAAVPDHADELRRILDQLARILRVAPGYESGQLLESRDEPGRFVVVAVWESPEAHERAVELLPVELLQRAMTLVSDLPRAGAWVDHS